MTGLSYSVQASFARAIYSLHMRDARTAAELQKQGEAQWASLATIIGVAIALFVIRVFGSSDLADGYHQERAAAYVMDAVCNGHWVCQYGAFGEVSSKPPMLTWLAALASLPTGQVTWFTLVLPSGIATIGIAALIYLAGAHYFGRRSGFLGALVYLVSGIAARQIAQVRVDGVFALTVFATALLAHRAWVRRTGWVWFWVAAAMATLTKGPLSLLLGSAGLLASVWEKRNGTPAALQGSHAVGIVLFLTLAGGWFVLAYAAVGRPLVDVMLGKELVGHAVSSDGAVPGQFFYLPSVTFFLRFAPWSLVACVGFWHVVKRAAVTDAERRFERFVLCSFFCGLAIFSFSPHQRPDLLFPLIPFAALLAGREMARAIEEYRPLTIARVSLVVVSVGFGAAIFKFHYSERGNLKVIRTEGLRKLAATVREQLATNCPIVNVDSPFAFQVFLGTKAPLMTLPRAAALLSESATVAVAVHDVEGLQRELGPRRFNVHLLAKWESPPKDGLYIFINGPQSGQTDELQSISPLRTSRESDSIMTTLSFDRPP